MINGRMEVLECHTFCLQKKPNVHMHHYFSSNILFLSCQAPVLSSNNNNQTKQGVLQNKHGHMTNHYAPHTAILRQFIAVFDYLMSTM